MDIKGLHGGVPGESAGDTNMSAEHFAKIFQILKLCVKIHSKTCVKIIA